MIKNAGFFFLRKSWMMSWWKQKLGQRHAVYRCIFFIWEVRSLSPLEAQECLNWGEWRRQSLSGWQTVWLWPSEPIASSDPCDVAVVSREVLIHSSFLLFVLRLFPQTSALVVQNSCPPVHDWGQRSWGSWVRVSVFHFLSRLHQYLPTCMSVLTEAPLTSEKGTARLWLQPWFPCREMPAPCWCPQLQIVSSVSVLLRTAQCLGTSSSDFTFYWLLCGRSSV